MWLSRHLSWGIQASWGTDGLEIALGQTMADALAWLAVVWNEGPSVNTLIAAFLGVNGLQKSLGGIAISSTLGLVDGKVRVQEGENPLWFNFICFIPRSPPPSPPCQHGNLQTFRFRLYFQQSPNLMV